ncbi:hypothetical protein Glove_232g148 [Diversispora epigaea]|uniref:Uncharacterized protein n=1 Tax=Diversispora epigaea TaxID=1348612 RepID=A0A397IG12_9GLOM|nr:hypothetical protein Glove_232g148 [Diversispora epigaea]
MLFRHFLISTFLLVGITTVAIGAPVAETIEVINAIKFPRMGSGNLTLDRRFIIGIPGLPQCTPAWPQLVFSYCVTASTIGSACANPSNPKIIALFKKICPVRTVCMDFVTDPGPSVTPEMEVFALCVDAEFAKRFHSGDKDGVYCKTYEINGVTGDKATLSVDIYDGTQNPAKVRSVSISTGNQYGSKQNTNNYSRIIDSKNGQKIKVCMDVLSAGITLYAMFTFVDGTYGSSIG